MTRPKRIGVLTSGGDCPGLNAVLRGVVRAAENLNWKVFGFVDGFEGLLPPGDFIPLTRSRTAGIMQLGGTIIGTTNRGHFVAKVGEGQRAEIPKEIVEQARETLRRLQIDAVIAIGGDGSLTTALQLHEAGLPMIGVPKTIDNDLEATATTFGFDSAVACVADGLDRLHTTARAHKRVMIIEVMGRHSGYIALGTAYGRPDLILVPEHALDLELLADRVKEIYDRQKNVNCPSRGGVPRTPALRCDGWSDECACCHQAHRSADRQH